MRICCDDPSKSFNSNNEAYYDDSLKPSNSFNRSVELFSTTKEMYTGSSDEGVRLFFRSFEISLVLLSPLILALLLSS